MEVSVNRHLEDIVALYRRDIVFVPSLFRRRENPVITFFTGAGRALTGRNPGLIERKNEMCTSIDGIFDAGYA